MSLFQDVQRIVSSLRSKVFLLAGRGTLKTTDAAKNTAKVQGEFLKDEIISDIEKMEDYGFSSYPEEGAQIVAIFVDGNREQGLSIGRMTDDTDRQICNPERLACIIKMGQKF